jgi:hypothetical protein
MSESKVAKAGFAVLAAAVLAILAVLIWLSQRETGATAAERGDDAPAARDTAPTAPAVAIEQPAGEAAPGRAFWEPGKEHWYGDDPDPFIRQPLDYGMDTPKILGNRISYHVYDLETVQDMVRRGQEADSEIARVKGRPLTDSERNAARAVIQEFFDETVPDVDGVIGGELSQDEAYDAIGPRRRQMNEDLRRALDLTEDEFYKIWPHVRDVEDNLDGLREPTEEELAEREDDAP